MTLEQLEQLDFEQAVELLYGDIDQLWSYQDLKDFAIYKIKDDNLFVAIHILEAMNNNEAEYYNYDAFMGALEEPTPVREKVDLQDFCYEGE